MKGINRDKILNELSDTLVNSKNKEILTHFANRVLDIADKAYKKGFDEGKKEVKNIDR